MEVKSCLNFEMSIPMKYMGFLLVKKSALLSATHDLSMYSRKSKRQALTN